jgi:hypothetical protein
VGLLIAVAVKLIGCEGEEQTAVGPLMAVTTGACANVFAKKELAKNKTSENKCFFIA